MTEIPFCDDTLQTLPSFLKWQKLWPDESMFTLTVQIIIDSCLRHATKT